MPKGKTGGATIKVGTIIDSMTSELAEVPRETLSKSSFYADGIIFLKIR